MNKLIFSILKKRLSSGYTIRLLLILLVIVVIAFFATESSVRAIISREILQEKKVMLFGLTEQLNNALEGTYEDILRRRDAMLLSKEEKIAVLHDELAGITDFVASGVPGVGVGYYSRELDAIITYGPESEFSYTIGQPIFEGHLGYKVMEEGMPIVQQGELVRGKILNCMLPVIRNDETIGYIWANETLEDVSSRLSIVFKQILWYTVIIFILFYIAVLFPTWYFNRRIDQLISDINDVMNHPRKRLPDMSGPLSSVAEGVNSLLDKVFYFKSNNEYIFDSVLSGILAVSMNGEILLANPAFLALINRRNENLAGEIYTAVLSNEFCILISEAFGKDCMEKPQEIIFNGKIIEVYNNVVVNDKNNPIGEVFIFRDRTLLKLYERRLNEQERLAALGEMGLSIAHEIKNPLTAVKGFSQLMHRRNMDQEKMNKYLVLMDDELNRIDKLLNDLLVNGGKSKFKPDDSDLSEIISEFIVIYTNSYPEVNFNISKEITGSSVVRVDKNKIAQLVDNIVKNSVDSIEDKPAPKEARIDFSLFIGFEEITLRIRDTGAGIPEENLNRIMTPFFTTKTKGTGLGMNLCLGIVEKHHGRIEVRSEENVFTEVIISLFRSKLEKLDES